MQLQSARQNYLEQHILVEELEKVVRTQSHPSSLSESVEDPSESSCDRSGDFICSAAELQHCLDIGPEATILGLSLDHLWEAAAMRGRGRKVWEGL